jgi:uncharacterized protein (TIGR02453 family)
MANQYLKFLETLAQNNHKSWMDENKTWYLAVKEEFLNDVSEMLAHISAWEPALSSFKAKDCVFRQNRDVRFSANKDPYKTNFAAYFSVGGKKSLGPGYYVHVQPGKSFIAGGIWMPESETLKKIRQEIDYSGKELEAILIDPKFNKSFPGLEGDKLKNVPKGYEQDHPYIELLKAKSFIVSNSISDGDISSGDFKKKAIEGFRLMKPFHDFLSRAIDDSESDEKLM